MPFAKLPENQFTRFNSVTCTHTNTCTRIRTYIEVTYTHTLKQSFDTRNDAWRESADMTRVFAKRSKHREVRTAQGTFVNWNHRSGSVTSKAAHENERVADCKFAEESNIRSLARALSLSISLARVCVWVCMPGQARGAQRASINMFAWPQRVKCLRRLLYVQHAAMCNMSQDADAAVIPSPSAHSSSLLYSLHKQATSIIISDVCSCSNKQ